MTMCIRNIEEGHPGIFITSLGMWYIHLFKMEAVRGIKLYKKNPPFRETTALELQKWTVRTTRGQGGDVRAGGVIKPTQS